MKVCVLYRAKSDHARQLEEFLREFERRQARQHLEIIDIDTREGTATASLYDILAYPAILALTDDGQLLKSWVGEEVPPLIDELAYYVHS